MIDWTGRKRPTSTERQKEGTEKRRRETIRTKDKTFHNTERRGKEMRRGEGDIDRV